MFISKYLKISDYASWQKTLIDLAESYMVWKNLKGLKEEEKFSLKIN